MIICEESFKGVNPNNVKYANYEINFYAWIPVGDVEDHRLSLRKNIDTREFEIYREFSASSAEEVIFRGKLLEAIQYGDNEMSRFHGFNPENKECDHSTHF